MPASADNPTPYRYNAALAESIELDWQRTGMKMAPSMLTTR